MKKFIVAMLVAVMSFGFSSCVSSQSIYDDYQKVYFDRVVYGHILADDYVWDGTYSYHVLGMIPSNVYWELYPIGYEVYLYSSNMIRMRLFDYTRRYIFYNRGFHNYYRFDDRHRPPMNPHMSHGNRPGMMMPRGGNMNRPGGQPNAPRMQQSRPGGNMPSRGSFTQGSPSRGGFGGSSPMRGGSPGGSSRGGSFGGGRGR